MGLAQALALGFGTTAIGMTVTFITLFGLCFILEMMPRMFGRTGTQN